MPVRDIEAAVATLAELQHSVSAEHAIGPIRKALRDRVSLVVAKAASVAAEMELCALVPDLCQTLERLMEQPAKADPKCWAKEAIAKALKELGHDQSPIFRKGSLHVQFEPVWGGETDTAATFRATCTLALAQCIDLDRQDKLWALMSLLSETSASVRKDGALAIEAMGGVEAALMLRIKARLGDEDITVASQVLELLLQLEGAAAVPFATEFLKHPDADVRSEAALVLGASRLDSAVAALTALLNGKFLLLDRETVYRALAISRHERALDVLLDAVRNGKAAEAVVALDALKMYKDNREVSDRVRDAVASRSEQEVKREFERGFPAE